MNRDQFKQHFNVKRCAVFIVIHVLDEEQTSRNFQVAMENGANGVFLINHDFDVETFLPIIRNVRRDFESQWMGLNFLGVTGKYAFPKLSDLESDGCRVDGYWADDARIYESFSIENQPEAREILDIKKQVGWNGLYFGGTAFKKQRPVDPSYYQVSAEIGSHWMDVVTTSGVATGHEPGVDKIDVFRQGVGDQALALASGITPENIDQYSTNLDAVLVATGINRQDDFYNIDPARLQALVEKVNH